MKKVFLLLASLCVAASAADLVSYDAPRPSNFPFRQYRQILPQAVPASLSAVVTQLTGCSSAVTGGTNAAMTSGCGVYINSLVISCPTGTAGTLLVQDLQSSPVALVPTITNTANTIYAIAPAFYWSPGGFKIQQVSGSGCTFYAIWGVL